MNVHTIAPAELPGTRQGSERRSQTPQGREARERWQVLAELAELLRSNPFLAAED
jgi:hypothetical protein